MHKDRYGNPVTVASKAACDLYSTALDGLLSGDAGVEEGFMSAIQADPALTMAHCALARTRQVLGDSSGARAAIADARSHAGNLTERETSHLHAMGLLIDGKVAEAYRAIRQHLTDYPRDAIIAQTCTSVFGLIGFSGQPGREAELLAYTAELLPHYGDDWWFLSQHAFSLIETGQTKPGRAMVERSLELNPRNAHAAHIRAHALYEAGEASEGARYLDEWIKDFPKTGILHCHLSWHIALWALEDGDAGKMWQTIDASVMPNAAWGPPLNVLTDAASILYRAQLAGVDVPFKYWQTMSAYAQQYFPKPGLAFADVHAALTYAMAGNTEALDTIVGGAKGPAGDLVATLGQAFGALAAQRWSQASALLTQGMADHARIGGSRAQRDLLEYALLACLLKQGESDQAKRLLLLRRPVQQSTCPVQGIH